MARGTGVPKTSLVAAMSGIMIGVGSSDVPVPLSLFGSVPLSDKSSAVKGLPLGSRIGFPLGSSASPEALAWFSRPPDDVPLTSGSIVTV